MLKAQLGLAITINIINICFAAWDMVTHPPDKRGVGTISIGSCSKMGWINSTLHITLNILSSLFLGAGNYCMQILAAPSREEVYNCHSKRVVMDIGVPSAHNLWYIERRRAIIWIALMIVATVLHLFWNSAIFSSIVMVAYPRALVTNDFMEAGDNWTKVSTNMTRLDMRSCVERYIDPLKATSTLIKIASNYTAADNNGSSLADAWVGGGFDSTWWRDSIMWICDAYQPRWNRYCSLDWASTFADHWLLSRHGRQSPPVLVDHCLVGDQGNNDDRCGLHYMCFCTAVESILIWCVRRLYLKEITDNQPTEHAKKTTGQQSTMDAKELTNRKTTMVTIDDAIANFLEDPDPFTENMSSTGGTEAEAKIGNIRLKAREWPINCRRSWFAAVAGKVWIVSLVAFAIGLAAPSYFLGDAIEHLDSLGIDMSFLGLWRQGFQVHAPSIMGGKWTENNTNLAPLRNILFANSWQLLLSFIYIFYNNILTRQLVADECPVGLQRSSYTLSLPLTYSVPLLVLFILIHWLISQSVFVVQTIVFGPGANAVRIPKYDTSHIGYSTLGIALSITLAGVLILLLIINSFVRKYPNAPRGFPSMAVNSAAISAVCHPPKDDNEAHLFHVSLGVIEDEEAPCHNSPLLQPVIAHKENKIIRIWSGIKHGLRWTKNGSGENVSGINT
ncbi:hypothetical protein F5884DRAFT_820450 [Xylogone sp. PMI_703]|nr:hypothetical protein F5884DRAFT_820450 [Xylogone sp. PMI_703]